MAGREIRSFAITTATGVASSAPQVDTLDMPPRIVVGIRLRIPPGPRGELGVALGAAGQQVIPWGEGQWLVADDEQFDWQLDGLLESGAWQAFSYNIGDYAHTWYVTFTLDVVQQAPYVVAPAPVADSAVYAAGSATGGGAFAAVGASQTPVAAGSGSGGPSVPPPSSSPPVAPPPASGGTSGDGSVPPPPPPVVTTPPPPPPPVVTTPPPPAAPAGPPPVDWSTMVWFSARRLTPDTPDTHGGVSACGTLLISSSVPSYRAVKDVPVGLIALRGIEPGGFGGFTRCVVPGTVLDAPDWTIGDSQGRYYVGIDGWSGGNVDRRILMPQIGATPLPLTGSEN